jgi:hypothetical protein
MTHFSVPTRHEPGLPEVKYEILLSPESRISAEESKHLPLECNSDMLPLYQYVLGVTKMVFGGYIFRKNAKLNTFETDGK